MNRIEFIETLRNSLQGIPKDDINKTIDFYNEILSDKIEDGMNEEDAINSLGSIDSILYSTLSEISFRKLIKEKIGRRKLKTWQIVLLSSTFYIWIPVSIALFAVALALYVSLWSGVIAVGAGALASACCSPIFLVWGIIDIFTANVGSGFMLIGLSLILAGAAILLTILTIQFAKLMLKVIKKLFVKMKSKFVKRGDLK